MKRDNFINQWWRAIDRSLVFTIIVIIIIGSTLITSASPAIALRIHLSPSYFIYHHIVYISIGFFVILIISLFNEKYIRYLGTSGMAISILLLMLVPNVGLEIKGAHRWLHIAGISIQPSEFAKIYFTIFNAIILSSSHHLKYLFSTILYTMTAILIVLEPDFGMTSIITTIFIGQLFISGIQYRYIAIAIILFISAALISYLTVPYVARRVDNFLHPKLESNFQVKKSLEALRHGGLIGVGPGEGKVKLSIPDAHTDFIFAVAAEEFGFLFCVLIISAFAFLTICSLSNIMRQQNMFHIITVIGLIIDISIPAIINMGVSLNLLPTKGMVMPFISYGGSSIIASSIAIGVILSLTKREFISMGRIGQ